MSRFLRKSQLKFRKFRNWMRSRPWLLEHEHFFKFPVKFLSYMAYDFALVSSATTRKEKWKIIAKNCYLWSHVLNVLMYVSITSYGMLLAPHDIQEVLFGVMSCLIWSFLAFKTAVYAWYKKDIKKMIDGLNNYYPKPFNGNGQNFYKKLKRYWIGSVVLFVICVLGFALIPLIVYLHTGRLVTPIPFNLQLFDPTQSVTYPLFYLWMILAAVQGCFLHFGLDMMTFTLISTISLEFENLADEFSEFFFSFFFFFFFFSW